MHVNMNFPEQQEKQCKKCSCFYWKFGMNDVGNLKNVNNKRKDGKGGGKMGNE